MAEARHVFLSGIQAPTCWRGKSHYVIAETGFGAGINFLATWKLWRETQDVSAKLFYISAEYAPLSKAHLQKAHAPYSAFDELSKQLRSAYPAHHPGYHLVTLDQGRVELLLLFGPVDVMLNGLMADVDGWYLDGFAPSHNPEMWSAEVFSAIGERSRAGTRVATYSSARLVRDGLTKAGFECEKVPGYALKRDSLRGVKHLPHNRNEKAPWFARSKPLRACPRIGVVGAGIAGACVAASLREAGADVTVIERHGGPAGESSGNPAGLIQPRPGGGNPAYEDLQTSAYLYALRTYDAMDVADAQWIGERGVLSFGRDEAFLERHSSWLRAGGLPDGFGSPVNAVEASDISRLDVGASATWFPQAGTIDPSVICRAMLEGIPAVYGTSITRLEKQDNTWKLIGADDRPVVTVDAVVLANGYSASLLCPQSTIPLYGKRGQVSMVGATDGSAMLAVGLSYGGYMTPALSHDGQNVHVLGATYQQWPELEKKTWSCLSSADDHENRMHVEKRLPGISQHFDGPVLAGRATLRTTTTDHLPVVGPTFDAAAYRADYPDLRHGKPVQNYPDATYTDGLYILSGLGSRGFALAPLLAKILTAEILGTPMPVNRAVHDLIHPARFLVRQLKRG